MRFILISFLLITLSGCFKGEKVDLIIHNAQIHTMDNKLSVHEAMAVHNGKIIEIGPERSILNRFRAEETINAEQKDIYPGFHDGHGHIMSLASQRLVVDLTGSQSYYEMLSRLEKFAQKKQPEFLVGRGWDQSLWGEEDLPTNELLNERFPDVPVALTRVDGHAMLVNETAFKLVGLDTVSNVEGGKIIYKNDAPTGLILDNAIDLVTTKIPRASDDALINEILTIQDELLAYGITHIHEAGIHYNDLQLLDKLATENKLKINIYAMLFTTEANKNFVKEEGIYKNNKLSVRSFKILMDGALGSRGACLLHPYSDMPDEQGFLLTSVEEMKKHTEFAKKYGYQVNTHCIGDSSNRIMLKRITELMDDTPDHRWRIEHAQVLHPDDFDLFTASGAIPSVQPTHATSDQRWAEKRLGKERLVSSYAYKTLLNKRGLLVLGTDFPVEDFDPFATIHAAVQRKNTDNEPTSGFLTDEKLSIEDAMKGMTIWAAQGCFEEHQLGSLEKGKQATFTILDQPFGNSANFKKNYAFKTFISGICVFDMDL